MKILSNNPLLRLLVYLFIGVTAIVGTGFLIAEMQALFEKMGHPLPRPIFLGILGGGVVYVAKWAMDICQRELALFRKERDAGKILHKES